MTSRIATKHVGTSYNDYGTTTSSTFIRDDVLYWIHAVDAIDQRSPQSNYVGSAVKGEGPIAEKGMDENLQLVQMPDRFLLHQNSPNPFNPATVIEFELPAAAAVSITIHDLLGRHLGNLLNGHMSAGFHQVTFDAGNLPSGVYVYNFLARPLEGNGQPFTQTRKMVLAR